MGKEWKPMNGTFSASFCCGQLGLSLTWELWETIQKIPYAMPTRR